jgi:hypothetical protein
VRQDSIPIVGESFQEGFQEAFHVDSREDYGKTIRMLPFGAKESDSKDSADDVVDARVRTFLIERSSARRGIHLPTGVVANEGLCGRKSSHQSSGESRSQESEVSS